jgi:hypothetical protein
MSRIMLAILTYHRHKPIDRMFNLLVEELLNFSEVTIFIYLVLSCFGEQIGYTTSELKNKESS